MDNIEWHFEMNWRTFTAVGLFSISKKNEDVSRGSNGSKTDKE